MKAFLVLVCVAIVLMFLGGWLYYHDSGGQSGVILDKQKVEQDTRQAVEKSEEVAEEVGEDLSELGEDIKDSVSGEKAEEKVDAASP